MEDEKRCNCGGVLVRLGIDNVFMEDDGLGEAWIVHRCSRCGAIMNLPEPVMQPAKRSP